MDYLQQRKRSTGIVSECEAVIRKAIRSLSDLIDSEDERIRLVACREITNLYAVLRAGDQGAEGARNEDLRALAERAHQAASKLGYRRALAS